MGGFSNVFGHVATGFEQARQIDAQRQFEAEENRRQQIGGFLQKLALDETAHPHTRNAAIQQYLKMTQTGKWKPDIEALIPPRLSAPAPPPGGAQPSFAAGAPGEAPQMSMPAPPPGLSQAMAGAGAGTTSTPGQAGAFMSPAEVTQMVAQRAGAVAKEQAGAEMKSTVYQQQPGGGLSAIPVMGSGAPGAAIPNVMPPQMFTGQIQGDKMPASLARQNGVPVPDEISDDTWVDVRRNRAGMVTNVAPTTPTAGFAQQTSSSTTVDPVTGLPTTTKGQRQRAVPGVKGGGGSPKMSAPAAPPGMELPTSRPNVPTVSPMTNTVGGRVLPQAAIGIISSQARNFERSGITPTGKTAPIVQQYMYENGMTPHTSQQVADYQKGFDQAMAEDKRLKMMSDLATKVASDPTPENIGSYDAALLAYHMGMTVGQVKGMRSGRDMILMHEKARSLPESMRQAVESWVNGAQLSPEQRANFVDLAKQSRQQAWSEAVAQAKGMGFSRFPQPTLGLPPLGLWPGVVNRQQLTSLAKDHHLSYGDARKQAIAAGMNVQD